MIDRLKDLLMQAKGNKEQESVNIMTFLKALNREGGLSQTLELLEHNNISPAQFAAIMRERKLWLQVLRNFVLLEGSWILGLKKMASLFKGRPIKQRESD